MLIHVKLYHFFNSLRVIPHFTLLISKLLSYIYSGQRTASTNFGLPHPEKVAWKP